MIARVSEQPQEDEQRRRERRGHSLDEAVRAEIRRLPAEIRPPTVVVDHVRRERDREEEMGSDRSSDENGRDEDLDLLGNPRQQTGDAEKGEGKAGREHGRPVCRALRGSAGQARKQRHARNRGNDRHREQHARRQPAVLADDGVHVEGDQRLQQVEGDRKEDD